MALAPAYVVRWHYGFYPTTLLEHAIVVTVLVFIFETWRSRARLEWRSPFVWPAALLVIAAGLDVVEAPSRVAALGLFRAYFVEPLAMAFVLVHIMNTPRRAFVVLAGLGVAGIVVSAPNAVVVLEALRAHTYDVTQTPPVVIYTTANALALFLGPLLALAATLLLHADDRNVRAGSAVFLVVAGPAMLLTFSRGGLLAMAVVAVGLAISHRRRLWLLAGTAAAAAVLLLIPPIFHRIAIEFQNVGGTTFFGRAGRLSLWSATLQMLSHYPVFGAGLSGFADRIGPYWNATHPERFIDPHNIVLNFWVETGVLGVIAMAWIFFAAFRWSWTDRRVEDGLWRAIDLGALLALVAVVVHGLVDVPYFKNDLSLEFWTIVALVECVRRFGRRLAASNPAVKSAA